MNTDLVEYYRLRASEYEAVYQKPERRDDLQALESRLKAAFAGLDALEIACGTGYWTQRIAETARSIAASDVNEEVLAVAKAKSYGCPVTFSREDLYRPAANMPPAFDGLFGGFIWSHIPRGQLKETLENLAKRIRPGGTLVFADNRFVAGSSTPVHSKDASGNTWQLRALGDGSAHLVLKNFPSADEIRDILSGLGSVEVRELTYFWMAECRLFSNKNEV